ncbi:murein hydrolase activator EnvC family protein [Flaviaesturariibacter terrae]
MKKQLLVILLVLVSAAAWAQPQTAADRARMENERKAIQKELRELQAQYSQIKGRTKATLGQLKVIQDRMEVQNRLLRSIDKEIHILSDDIYLSTLELNRLQRQLDTLKEQYARSVVYAYKNRSSYDYLNFVFSAESFNDALKRVRYLRTYRLYRQSQLTTIRETAKAIEERKQQLLAKRNDKNRALANQTEQYNELEDQRKEKDRVASQLKTQEKELSKELASKRKRDNQLKQQIAVMIRREIEAAKREAERREAERRAAEAAAAKANPSAPKTTPKTTPKPKRESVLIFNEGERALAATFERNRGNLPWPVDQGSVKIPYGISKVGGLDFDNAFLTLATPNAGAAVKAVFDGEVTLVTGTADVMTVMIRHGKYFTIYSGLANVNVSKGTQVKRGQVIGTTSEDDDGSGGKLDFGMQMEYTRLNPSSWLHR